MSSRDARATMARQTLQILEQGHYVAPSGARIEVGDQIAHAVAGTCEYGPAAELPNPPRGTGRTRIAVSPMSTFDAAYRMRTANPVALNFASAKHPGGGFLSGAQAQEEALARNSALYACIRDRRMYRDSGPNTLYTHAMIYSPAVPVFRDDNGTLLETPWRTAIITAAAPNAGVFLEREPLRTAELDETLRERARRVLAVAHTNGHRHLVLGAWGCGVFRNEPTQVATTFKDLLTGDFAGAFELAVFAILDRSKKREVIGAFERVLAG